MFKNIFKKKKSFPKILAVGVILEDSKGNILLRKRLNDPDYGKWELFVSYVEPKETLKEAVKRTLLQKANYFSKNNGVEFTGKYYDKKNRHPGTNCIPLIFKQKVKREDIELTSRLCWFKKSELKDLRFALDNGKILRENL